MTTRADVEQALQAAHAAGDTHGATQLAAALQNWPDEGSHQEQVDQKYANMGTGQAALQSLNDLLRIGSSAVTFGQIDKLRSAVKGTSLADEQQATKDARYAAGVPGGMVDVAAPMAALSGVPSIGAKASELASSGLGKLMAYLGGNAAEGAAYSGTDAALNGGDVPTAMEHGAVAGTVGGVGARMLTKGANRLADVFDPPPSRMRADQLEAAKNNAYDAVTQANVEYAPPFIRKMLAGMGDETARAYPGRHDETIAATDALNSRLDNGRAASLGTLDKNRQIIRMDVADLPDKSQSSMGVGMIKSMDDSINNAGPGDVTPRSGDPVVGADLIQQARDLANRQRKLNDIGLVSDKANRQAAINLQSGTDTTTRQKLNNLLNSSDGTRGYTPDETQAMNDLVTGKGTNWLRQLGRFAPGGGLSIGGMGGAFGLGNVVGGPFGGAVAAAGVPAAGWLAKKAAERGTQNQLSDLMDLIASGGNRQAMQRTPAIGQDGQDALQRLLMLQQLGGANGYSVPNQ